VKKGAPENQQQCCDVEGELPLDLPWFAQGSGPIGAGNPKVGQEGPESSMSCAISSDELVNLCARPKRLLIADERAA
jgi:hypothetical protein